MSGTGRFITFGVAAALATGTLVASGSSAALAAPAPDVTTATINAAQLFRGSHDLRSAGPVERARIDAYVLDNARRGRIVDASVLRVASGTEPSTGARITSVWESSYQPREFRVAVARTATAGASGFGAAYADVDAAAGLGATLAGGFGFAGAVSTSNMYLQDHGCATTFFVPDYTSPSDHVLTSCFEKWAQSGTNRWIYNRWGLFTQAPDYWWDILTEPLTNDFTLRSRPWKGLESRVSSIGGWIPLVGGSTCTNVANLSVSVGSNVSITVPIHQCEGLETLPNATQHSMGLDWDGWTGDQRFLDFALALYAANNTVVPVYADYSWATVNYCVQLAVCIDENLLTKDTGW